LGGGNFAGGHFGGARFGASRLGGGGRTEVDRFAGQAEDSRIGGGRTAGGARIGGGRQFGGRNGVSRNAFGNQRGWNRFAGGGGVGGYGGYDWGGGWGGWGGWAGPVFWPYLFGDILSSSLWPYADSDPFWAYGTSPAFDYGVYQRPFYGYSAPYDVYGSYPNGYYNGGRSRRSAAVQANIRQFEAQATQSCAGLAPDVTGLPIDRGDPPDR
jgi:hypothetical protein